MLQKVKFTINQLLKRDLNRVLCKFTIQAIAIGMKLFCFRDKCFYFIFLLIVCVYIRKIMRAKKNEDANGSYSGYRRAQVCKDEK